MPAAVAARSGRRTAVSRPKEKPHKCPECNRGFKTPWGMDEHRAFVHGVERSVFAPDVTAYRCQVCKKNCGSEVSLVKHMRAAHPVAMPPVGRRPTVTEIDATCQECGGEGQLVSGKAIYPHRPDLFHKSFYLCECGAYCGCHPGSIVPLGHPCGPETRRARSAAHEAFDPLWRGKSMSRASAYKWLAGVLEIDPAHCHIGMMPAKRAWDVVRAVAARQEAA